MSAVSGGPLHDVIIIGGSYSGLSAALVLGRARRNVLVIDRGEPCNRVVQHAQNLLTHDGRAPAEIRALALQDLSAYPNVRILNDEAVTFLREEDRARVKDRSGNWHDARKILLAFGVKDEMPTIPGFAECWGLTVAHCPYCHGYELRDQRLGVRGNGDPGFEYARLLTNWTDRLTLFTDGPSTLSAHHTHLLKGKGVIIEERPIVRLEHTNGQLGSIVVKGDIALPFDGLFSRVPFTLPQTLIKDIGCALTEIGLIAVDERGRTNVPGVSAAGDCTIPLRSLAQAIGSGNAAGAFLNHALTEEDLH
ncbi:MAG TPA: NAD(P)/FAD-dependent oxidoreductase [Flavobacteriales bacterium]